MINHYNHNQRQVKGQALDKQHTAHCVQKAWVKRIGDQTGEVNYYHHTAACFFQSLRCMINEHRPYSNIIVVQEVQSRPTKNVWHCFAG